MLAWNETARASSCRCRRRRGPAPAASVSRKSGNTLGCVKTNNNLVASQHFFALKLNKEDLLEGAAGDAKRERRHRSDNRQIAQNGGPPEIRDAAEELGKKPHEKLRHKKPDDLKIIQTQLTADVMLISKPSNAERAALADGVGAARRRLRAHRHMVGLAADLLDQEVDQDRLLGGHVEVRQKSPGDVIIAKNGTFGGRPLGLIGGQNHAKVGVVTSGRTSFSIFGDLNQQGTINPVKGKCDASQNGRGGMFFVVKNDELFKTLSDMLEGEDEPFKAK